MSIRNFISTSVITTTSETPINRLIEMMYQEHVGTIVIVNHKNGSPAKPLGIVTDRDIVLKLKDKENFMYGFKDELQAKDIMTSNLIIGTPEDDFFETIQKMKNNGVRRIPIIDHDDQVIGILSADDLYFHLGQAISDLSAIICFEVKKEKKLSDPIPLEKEITQT